MLTMAIPDADIFGGSLVRYMLFNLFAIWHQHVWFKRWGEGL